MEHYGGMISTGKAPDLSTIDLRQSYQQSFGDKARETGEGNYKFGLMKYLCSDFEKFFNIP
jgi:hypothetical protein